jgi:hypothetical protein
MRRYYCCANNFSFYNHHCSRTLAIVVHLASSTVRSVLVFRRCSTWRLVDTLSISHYLISNVLAITHHPSPITHHPSPITHHPSPITHHTHRLAPPHLNAGANPVSRRQPLGACCPCADCWYGLHATVPILGDCCSGFVVTICRCGVWSIQCCMSSLACAVRSHSSTHSVALQSFQCCLAAFGPIF